MNEASKDSVVGIYVNGERQATGVVVGKDKIITCLHVIDSQFESREYDKFDKEENPKNLKIEVEHNGKKYPAEITRGNQHHDLCLLNVKGLEASPLPIAPISYAPKDGDKVFSIGLPDGEMYSGEGRITRLDKIKSGEPSLVINNAPSKSGCSGGALLNENGQLIGIQSLPDASLPHAWINELMSRSDNKIISRSHKPETEVDYYFEAISRFNDLKSSKSPFVNWVLDRPESEFAAINFAQYNANSRFEPKLVTNPDDYGKILKTLEAHNPKILESRLKWLKYIANTIPYQTPYREKYLLKALESAESKEEKAKLCFNLGNYYNYGNDGKSVKNPQKAIEFFDRGTSLMDGTGDLLHQRKIAYDSLCNLHLAAGDKEKVHKALIGGFEIECRELRDTGNAVEHNYHDIFDVVTGFTGRKDQSKLFNGDFERDEVFRKCVRHIEHIFPPKQVGVGGPS